MKAKKSKKPIGLRERNFWGDIKPITKIIPNKKKNPRIKHKNRADLDNQPYYFFISKRQESDKYVVL